MRIKCRVFLVLFLAVAFCLASCGEQAVDPGSMFELSLSGDSDEQFYIIEEYIGDAKNITIPSEYNGIPIRVIGDYAFSEKDLKSVVICDGIIEIGCSAFRWNGKLKEISIPETVEVIGEHAFEEMKALKEIILPQNLKVLGYGAFNRCSSLKEVVVPGGITIINDGTFNNCDSLVKIEILNGVHEIGVAFDFCDSLEEISIPASVEIMDPGMFLYVDNLKRVNYGGTEEVWQSFDCYIPEDCEITFQDNVNDVSTEETEQSDYRDDDVPATKGLKMELNENGTYYRVVGVSGSVDKNVVIPEVYKGISVKEVADKAFDGCVNIETISMPQSILTVGNSVFYGCDNLVSVSIPNAIQIDTGVFTGCSSIVDVTIPADFLEYTKSQPLESITITCVESTYIRKSAFAEHASLKTVTISQGITEIGEDAFANCALLESVSLPEGLQVIGSFAFGECPLLKNVVLPSTLEGIYTAAFKKCTSITEITIPASVTSIGEGAFYGCSSLQNVMIEEGVRSIGGYTDSSFGVFEECNIEEIVIPESVTYIDESAFCDNPLQTAIFKNPAGWKIGVGYGLYDPIYLDGTDLADSAFAAYILLKVNGSDQYNHMICSR